VQATSEGGKQTTFALGTAAGDLTSEGLHWGYVISTVIFAASIGAVVIGFYLFKLDAILSFRIAYILTRPLGASCGDLLIQPIANGGLGMSTFTINVICLFTISALVLYLTVTPCRSGHLKNRD
jgi:uncharacterized membrane-anchored protein